MKNRPLGTGNIVLAEAVSSLANGLFFQAVAEAELSDLNKFSLVTQQNSFKKHLTKEIVKEILNHKAGHHAVEVNSVDGLLTFGRL
ncbi:hypothetical protein ACFL3G_06875 [Planctomycetota bacterium]